MLTALRTWPPRRWWVALAAALAAGLVIAVPTAMVPTPVFSREIPVTWWSWPTLAATATLTGLLVASYVGVPGGSGAGSRLDRRGGVGGLLSFFAVGCPVCNKLALVALGYSGAVQWFAPVQPVLAVAGVGVLGWALRSRLRGEVSCPMAPTRPPRASDSAASA